MGVASVRTQLSLDRFCRLISYSPILFNQVYIDLDEMQPVTSCSDPILQYTWQPRSGGRPGREEIANAIQQAEENIERWLKFPLAPKWIANDLVIPNRGFPGGWWPQRPYQLGVQASNFYLIEGGQEAFSVISAAAPIVYTDPNGDGYFERATVTVATSITDVDEIAVYYPSSASIPAHDPAWEIRPITVSIAAGVATITFERHQAVMPDLLTALDATGVLGTVDGNFLTTVDVYRHYSDPSSLATVEWEGGCWCEEAACVINTQAACFSITNPINGTVQLHAADYDSTTQEWTHTWPTWWTPPSRIRLWYRAGYRGVNLARPMNEMSSQLERAIAFYALALMDRPWENCEQLRNMQNHWRTDLAIRKSNQSESVGFNISRSLLENPLGTTRAAIDAWRVVQRLQVGEAVIGS